MNVVPLCQVPVPAHAMKDEADLKLNPPELSSSPSKQNSTGLRSSPKKQKGGGSVSRSMKGQRLQSEKGGASHSSGGQGGSKGPRLSTEEASAKPKKFKFHTVLGHVT